MEYGSAPRSPKKKASQKKPPHAKAVVSPPGSSPLEANKGPVQGGVANSGSFVWARPNEARRLLSYDVSLGRVIAGKGTGID